ncbi:hypothetical protein C9994_05090 [Marivirga lumbricoides]|uniref:PKD domain-containing protein n=1 Tax=Marivirga lumbricoides TaxID=1046115 RepID=A0A2T4DT23_9BACT|nr:hypothetical protein C9994_05090 [Marivirga lumbricoides]
MKKILLLSFIFLYSAFLHAQTEPYVPGLVVIKLKQEAGRGTGEILLNEAMLQEDNRVQKVEAVISSQALQRRGQSSILSGIYKIDLQADINEEEYLNYLNSFDNVAYAEPYPNVYPLLVPNDPQAKIGASQTYLEQIKAYLAWDISQGDSTKIIGIIDTGVDLDHEDLRKNLYLNTADPIDGVDNDGDGYIDNYYGWDFADGDHMPEADGSAHGTGVAGIAAASTNNSLGMAGIGFQTKFMPLKIFRSSDNSSRNSYEAIIYAADKGCDVINLSWGSSGRYSQFAQDIINYAVLEKDVVVVAAAGNTNAELDFFPASYDNVTSVGFVNGSDVRDPNATYSNYIDVAAPGVSIYTTQNNNTYNRDGGSSYAAPMVAGAAALIRAVHPEWNALQVMEQLRVNSDDISAVADNSNFEYKFGKGRLNIFKALANFDDPAIRISNVNYTNGLEQAAYFGDTLSISLEFTNYLESAENVEVTLTSESEYVTIVNSNFTIPSLATSEKTSNDDSPFVVILSENLPENEVISFRILMEGELYSDYQSFRIFSSPKTQIYNFNNWRFGFTSTGNIGRSYENPFISYSLRYKGISLLDHLGIALATAEDSISKNMALDPESYLFTEELETVERLKRYNDVTADFDVRSVLKEQDTISSKLGIYIRQRLLGWQDEGEEGLLILKYQLMNRSNKDYKKLYFGFLADWAVGGQANNKIQFDSLNRLVYAYNSSDNLYAGLAVIEGGFLNFNAIDVGNSNGNTSDLINNEFTDSLLWKKISEIFQKRTAGDIGVGNDVASMYSLEMNDFYSGSSSNATLALLTAESTEALYALLDKAKERNHQVYANPPMGRQVYVCPDDSPIISTTSKSTYKIYSDALSSTVIYEGTDFEPGVIKADTTFYYEEIDSAGFTTLRKRLQLAISKPVAQFELPDQPFLLNPDASNSYRFLDASKDAVSWKWSFSNGFQSTKRNPLIAFNEATSIDVQLIVENYIGCIDTINQTFITRWRASVPKIASVEICSNSRVSLEDPALQEIVVYQDLAGSKEIYRGQSFLTPPVSKDTVFYIRNETGEYPSLMAPVAVKAIPLQAAMEVINDINSDNDKGKARNKSKFASSVKWLLGNQELGSSDTVSFDLLALQNQKLKLLAFSQSGCVDTLIFNPVVSEVPVFDDFYTCSNSNIIISATNTSSLLFYADSSLTQFIGKGEELLLSNVQSDTSIYAVNINNVVPSAKVKIPIYVNKLNADFKMSTDTLNTAFNNSLSLEGIATNVGNWEWRLGSEQTYDGRLLNVNFDAAGVYDISLTVKDYMGCIATETKKLVVVNDPLLGNEAQLKSFFSIFPNPANKFIHLKARGDFKYDSYKIMDVKGAEILTKKSENPVQQAEVISTSELKNGPYYLVLKKGKSEAAFLFIVKH